MPITMSYAEIFGQRGQAHDEAFRRYPEACREESEAILRLAGPQTGETLLDLPSAGGFLSTYLRTPGVNVLAVDPSPQLHALCQRLVPQSYLAPLDDLPFPDGHVNVAVCLAGLHHETSLPEIFAEMHRVLRPGGRLAIAEVAEGSPVAGFLNGFVDGHNSLGHRGNFLDDSFAERLEEAGFRVTLDEDVAYHWRFASRAALADCLRLMFGIDRATPELIISAVEQELGIDELPDGWIGMRWSLRHQLCVKQS